MLFYRRKVILDVNEVFFLSVFLSWFAFHSLVRSFIDNGLGTNCIVHKFYSLVISLTRKKQADDNFNEIKRIDMRFFLFKNEKKTRREILFWWKFLLQKKKVKTNPINLSRKIFKMEIAFSNSISCYMLFTPSQSLYEWQSMTKWNHNRCFWCLVPIFVRYFSSLLVFDTKYNFVLCYKGEDDDFFSSYRIQIGSYDSENVATPYLITRQMDFLCKAKRSKWRKTPHRKI